MNTPMTFPATSAPLYRLDRDAPPLAITDQLLARQFQLQALLAMTYGEQGDAFRTLSDELQDGFMWSCSMLACEIRDLTAALRAAERRAAA